jgi:hypothetical protein
LRQITSPTAPSPQQPTSPASLLRIAGPLFIEAITNIATQLVATTCVARLGGGPLALSALVLAQTQLNFGYSIICGISAAMETCCGQAFGAGQYALLGLVMQVGGWMGVEVGNWVWGGVRCVDEGCGSWVVCGPLAVAPSHLTHPKLSEPKQRNSAPKPSAC